MRPSTKGGQSRFCSCFVLLFWFVSLVCCVVFVGWLVLVSILRVFVLFCLFGMSVIAVVVCLCVSTCFLLVVFCLVVVVFCFFVC